MPNPENKEELQRLVGLVKYLISFKIIAPLRILLKGVVVAAFT